MKRRMIAGLALLGSLLLLCTLRPYSLAIGSQTERVKFCDLVREPRRYAGKLIRTKAVLVENHRDRVDGADPFLYDPACRSKDYLVLANWPRSSQDESRAMSELDSIRARPDKRGNSRASVTVVGRFESGGRYGHLDWAHSQLIINSVDKAEQVSASAAWPKEYD
jgi:hypothetical protein